jgi:hypothetical protein
MAELSFKDWLREQAEGDPDRLQPHAGLYDVIDTFPDDGEPDLEAWSESLREDLGVDVASDLVSAYVHASKLWRLDLLAYSEDPDLMYPDEKTPMAKALPERVETKELAKATFPCGFRGRDGHTCGMPSVEGSVRCTKHGGAITDSDVRRSLIISAYGRMIESTEIAVAALIDVAEMGRSEMARVQAARELLDRAGMTIEASSNIHNMAPQPVEEEKATAAERARSMLADVRNRLQLVTVSNDDEVIDAEVVEPELDEPEAEAL